MTKTNPAPAARPAAKITTEEGAAAMRNRPQTWRASFCRHGHYLGMVPIKLPNGRLLWDAAEVERLLAGEGSK